MLALTHCVASFRAPFSPAGSHPAGRRAIVQCCSPSSGSQLQAKLAKLLSALIARDLLLAPGNESEDGGLIEAFHIPAEDGRSVREAIMGPGWGDDDDDDDDDDNGFERKIDDEDCDVQFTHTRELDSEVAEYWLSTDCEDELRASYAEASRRVGEAGAQHGGGCFTFATAALPSGYPMQDGSWHSFGESSSPTYRYTVGLGCKTADGSAVGWRQHGVLWSE